MIYKKILMGLNKKIALVAHDNKKRDLLDWAKYNRDLLAHHVIYANWALKSPGWKAVPWAATSKSAPKSSGARSIS